MSYQSRLVEYVGHPVAAVVARDYDTARYNYKFMSTNLMQATEKYAEENGKENRPITLEICEWGGRQPWVWGGETGNMWRTTGDIAANWNCAYCLSCGKPRTTSCFGRVTSILSVAKTPSCARNGRGDR